MDIKLYRVRLPLGKGHFGVVDRGIWNDSNGMIFEVALKSVKRGASMEERVKLLQEAAIMAQFRHPNVLQSYGVVAQPDLVKRAQTFFLAQIRMLPCLSSNKSLSVVT